MKILAFHNFANHSSGAAVLTDERGKLEYVTISEERLSRVKYSYFFPLRSIQYCMEYFNIKRLSDFDLVVSDYSMKPQFLNTNYRYRKLEADYLKTKLDIDYNKAVFVNHHDAHAASAFYPSGFEEAAILVVDGQGSEGNTHSLYVGTRSGGLRLVERSYGTGIGILYHAITTNVLNFGTGEDGKTMGLSAVGEKVRRRGRILNLKPEYSGLRTDYSSVIPRVPMNVVTGYPKCENPKKDVTNDYYSRIAYEVQKETERAMLHLAHYAYKKTGKKNLCLAGGVALNCVANDRIVNEGPFERVFIQPASSDTGIPFGLALFAYYDREKRTKHIVFPNAFTGRSYDVGKSAQLLRRFRIPHRRSSLAEVALHISKKNIVGFLAENSEFGPRALGHRSILADARYADMKDILNAKVKHREMFRPFAPSILEEKAKDYFEMKTTSPFMLLAPMVRKDKLDTVPAIVHLDGSARVQTVNKNDNSRYHELISEFEKLTGVPLVLNTSFNDNGEPIVETPLDALICFLRTKMDYLYIDGLLIEKAKVSRPAVILKDLLTLRERTLKENYKAALKRLCPKYSANEMRSFLREYYTMHLYFSRLHPLLKLQEVLIKFNGARVVTDKYHLDVIKRSLPEEFSRCGHKIQIVKDVRTNVSKIKNDSLVILFNASLYLPKGEKILNFYEDLSMPLVRALVPGGVSGGALELSNEFRSSKDWDSFYADILRQV